MHRLYKKKNKNEQMETKLNKIYIFANFALHL